MKRAEVLAKIRREHFKNHLAKRKRDKAERNELRKQGIEPARKVPRTIENTRIRDETTVGRDDVETLQDVAVDELSTYFAGKAPKILITTNTHPSRVSGR
jgi:ribosome production factor 1